MQFDEGKTKKVKPTYKRVFENFFNQLPMAFVLLNCLFYLNNVELLGIDWMYMYGVVESVFCCRLLLSLSLPTLSSLVIFCCNAQRTEQSNCVKDWECQKVEGWSPDNSQFYVIWIRTYIQYITKTYRVKKPSIEKSTLAPIIPVLEQCRISVSGNGNLMLNNSTVHVRNEILQRTLQWFALVAWD